MYACILENGLGFFEGVRAPNDATAYSYDPPPPPNTREPEPQRQGSGPERITHRTNVGQLKARTTEV
jgi:hypothetical protein